MQLARRFLEPSIDNVPDGNSLATLSDSDFLKQISGCWEDDDDTRMMVEAIQNNRYTDHTKIISFDE